MTELGDPLQRLVGLAYGLSRLEEPDLIASGGRASAERIANVLNEFDDGAAFARWLYSPWFTATEIDSALVSVLRTLGGYSDEIYGVGPEEPPNREDTSW